MLLQTRALKVAMLLFTIACVVGLLIILFCGLKSLSSGHHLGILTWKYSAHLTYELTVVLRSNH